MIPSPVDIIYEANVDNMQLEQKENASAKKQWHIKRPLNSFMLWSRDRRKEISLYNPKLNLIEISKQLSVEWNRMPEKEKQPFIDEAKRLREQYVRDRPQNKCITAIKNPYLLWSRIRRREILFANPKLHISEINRQLCAEWKLLTIEEKRPFMDKAKRLSKQHLSERLDGNCSYQPKQKSVMETSEPSVVPHSMSSYSHPNFDAGEFVSNPPVSAYYTEQRSNPPTGYIPTYDMYSTTYPAISYESNSQCRDNKTFTLTTGHNDQSVPHYQCEYMNSEQLFYSISTSLLID